MYVADADNEIRAWFEAAIKEAQKFIERGNAVIKESDNNWIWGTQATGALRRSSMELTRALAEMRKAN